MTNHPQTEELGEDRQSLWLLTTSPALWMAHFLVSYAAAAAWCGKLAGREGAIGGVRAVILGLGIAVLAGIAVTGLRGWRKHSHGKADPPHDQDTPEDRHRFLGLATVLLSGLSAIATIYVMLSTFFVGNCA